MVARMNQGNVRKVMALLVLLTYLSAPGLGAGTVSSARAQTADDLERAREHYEFAEFDQALALLAWAIALPDETPQRLRDAYVLQARCQVGLGNRNLAEDSFCEALALDPDWRPDPIFFPRSELEVFESARVGCPPPTPVEPAPVVRPAPAPATAKAWYQKPVVWAAAAGAVILAVVLLGGGDDDPPQTLPDPPPPPARP
jgi:hypothetical protein